MNKLKEVFKVPSTSAEKKKALLINNSPCMKCQVYEDYDMKATYGSIAERQYMENPLECSTCLVIKEYCSQNGLNSCGFYSVDKQQPHNCRYCANAHPQDVDLCYCSVKNEIRAKQNCISSNKCKSFVFNEIDVFGFDCYKTYKPRTKTEKSIDMEQIKI